MADKVESTDHFSQETNSTKDQENSPVSTKRAAIFTSCATFASLLGGFSLSLGMARRRSPDAFSGKQNDAVRLALRALGWGTALAVGGVGMMVLSVKTALGVHDAKEFGERMSCMMPSNDGKLVKFFEGWRIPRNSGENNLEEADSIFSDSSSSSKSLKGS